MKRTKKLLALVLALMMAFSCMSMPAMAANEEIMRHPAFACDACGQELTEYPSHKDGQRLFKCLTIGCENFGKPVYY